MTLLRFLVLLLFIKVVKLVEANNYGSISDKKLSIKDIKCYNKCINDCVEEHRCESSIFLDHCIEVCDLICTHQIHVPPSSVSP